MYFSSKHLQDNKESSLSHWNRTYSLAPQFFNIWFICSEDMKTRYACKWIKKMAFLQIYFYGGSIFDIQKLREKYFKIARGVKHVRMTSHVSGPRVLQLRLTQIPLSSTLWLHGTRQHIRAARGSVQLYWVWDSW